MMTQELMAGDAQALPRNFAFGRNRLRIASAPRIRVKLRGGSGLASSSIADGSWRGGFRGPFLCV